MNENTVVQKYIDLNEAREILLNYGIQYNSLDTEIKNLESVLEIVSPEALELYGPDKV